MLGATLASANVSTKNLGFAAQTASFDTTDPQLLAALTALLQATAGNGTVLTMTSKAANTHHHRGRRQPGGGAHRAQQRHQRGEHVHRHARIAGGRGGGREPDRSHRRAERAVALDGQQRHAQRQPDLRERLQLDLGCGGRLHADCQCPDVERRHPRHGGTEPEQDRVRAARPDQSAGSVPGRADTDVHQRAERQRVQRRSRQRRADRPAAADFLARRSPCRRRQCRP